MFSFFKKKQPVQVPGWASFFNEKQYGTFIAEIDRYFKTLKVGYEIADGAVDVQENDFGFTSLGLTNLAQVCNQDEEKNYREIVKAHFNSLKRANRLSSDFSNIINDFEKVKEHIGVRIYHNDFIDYVGVENTVSTDLAGDIKAVLVFDFPESIETIKRDQAAKWCVDFDELLDLGIANIKKAYSLNITSTTFNNFEIYFINEDHFFTPNVVFALKESPELIGTFGSLIGLPHRHSAIIYPIQTIEVVTVITDLIPLIFALHKEGPGSLSNELFWYYRGELTSLPYKFENQKIEFYPTELFLESVLNKLE